MRSIQASADRESKRSIRSIRASGTKHYVVALREPPEATPYIVALREPPEVKGGIGGLPRK